MQMSRKAMIGIGAAAALAAGGTGVAVAVGTGADDSRQEGRPVPASAAAQAKDAALKVTGGGTVTAIERDGENGATYEVELTKPDGRSVDVRLDDAFRLVGQPEPNGDAAEGNDGQDRGDGDGEHADDGGKAGAVDHGDGDGETNDD